MTVPFVHDFFAIDLARLRPEVQARRVRAEPHGAAHVDDLSLLVHQVDHRVRAVQVELARVRTRETTHVATEFDHRAVQAEAQPQERHAVLARIARRGDLAFDAAYTEP